MKFIITMHMPVRTKPPYPPQPVHQVIAEYPVSSLEAFASVLKDNEFLVVEEFYKDEGGYFSTGNVILNTDHVGKVKILN